MLLWGRGGMSLKELAALAAKTHKRPIAAINLTECLSCGRIHSRTC